MNTLDPQAREYLKLLKKVKSPSLPMQELKFIREKFTQAPPETSSIFVELEDVKLSKIKDLWITVKKNKKIKLRIYTPEGDGPFPLFVYYHGGGWVIGDLEWSDASCKMLANKIRCVVISVNYRLAPENKYPIPLNDSYEALKWVEENTENLNGDASKLIVGGDSAGGNLANAVSMISKKNKGPKIINQILIYPVTNMTFNTKSYEEFQVGYGLDKDKMIWYSNQYINNESDKKNELIAPILSNELNGLPPTLIIVAENDVLRDDALYYAKRLKDSGVNVQTIFEEGLIHGYFTNMNIFQERIQITINKIKKGLEEINKTAFKY